MKTVEFTMTLSQIYIEAIHYSPVFISSLLEFLVHYFLRNQPLPLLSMLLPSQASNTAVT